MKYKSLFDIWKQSSLSFGNSIAFCDNKKEVNVTYSQAYKSVCFLAGFFSDLGIKRFDKVSLFAVNSPYWLILEQAVITLGAVCVAKTSEINCEELKYVFENSDSCAIITDNFDIITYFQAQDKDFLNKIKFVLFTGDKEKANGIQSDKIIFFEDILGKIENCQNIKTDWEETPEDTAYINYTSGTSAMPKGAMLPNIGMAYVVEQLQKFNDIKKDNLFVVTFPLSSAGGKSFNLLCFSEGCTVLYTPYKEFWEVIEKYKPDYLHCAPKILQTMYSKFIEAVKSKGTMFKNIYFAAYSVSKLILNLERNFFYKNKLLFIKPLFDIIKNLFDKKIYKPIRNVILKDGATIFAGSAHLAKPLEDYFIIMNIPLIQHYGLTETTGLAVSNTLDSQKTKPYTVGIAFDGTDIKIINPETHEELPYGEIGLITLGGPEIMKGYYKNQEATQKALLSNGYLNTGDLGFVDKDGYLVVLSRYDDVIVMSNGYNVYTPLLENEAKDSEYINQIVITGHGKPYLTALIVLNKGEYVNFCKSHNITANNPNNNEIFKSFLIEHINEKIKRKSEHKYYEKLKKIYFLKENFTEENGMLTSTLKVKYKKVCNTYQKEIEDLYKDN